MDRDWIDKLGTQTYINGAKFFLLILLPDMECVMGRYVAHVRNVSYAVIGWWKKLKAIFYIMVSLRTTKFGIIIGSQNLLHLKALLKKTLVKGLLVFHQESG